MKYYRILLADDHPLFREGIRRIVESTPGYRVVGEVGDGLELLGFLRTGKADLVILDVSMPKLQGIDAAREIKTTWPAIAILILTMYRSPDYFQLAMQAGVNGYLLKENAPEDLNCAIRTIKEGRSYISPLLQKLKAPADSPGGKGFPSQMLTRREKEILALIAFGNSNKQISDRLCISIMTVQNHRASLKRKLNLKNMTELIFYAIENGYLPPAWQRKEI